MNIPFQSQLVPQWSYQLNCEPCLYLHKIWKSHVIYYRDEILSVFILPGCIARVSKRHVSSSQVVELPQCTQATVDGMASLYAN